MKLLHTADWHLGKLFYEQSLEQDQQHVLAQVMGQLQDACSAGAPYDALLVCGDIYDRAVPPASATRLLDWFLTEVTARFPELHVLMLAGNHDSAERLAFGRALFARHNVHLCTDCADMTRPVMVGGVAVYQLPFLTPARLLQALPDEQAFSEPPRTQQELVARATGRILAAHEKAMPGTPAVLCAHLFAAGTLSGQSETSCVGTAEQVDAATFAPFSYVALGHIHSAQKAGHNAWYPGSPLSYSFGERDAQKYLLSVTVDAQDGAVTVQKIPVSPLRPVSVVTGSFDDLLNDLQFDGYREHFVQARCTGREVIVNPMARLAKRFPHILSFVYDSEDSAMGRTTLSHARTLVANGHAQPAQIFSAFLDDVYGRDGSQPDDGLTAQEKQAFDALVQSSEEPL